MKVRPSLHVVASPSSLLPMAIEGVLDARVRVQNHTRLPTEGELAPADVVVIDLTGPPSYDPIKTLPLTSQHDVYLACGERPISGRWLVVARRARIGIVECDLSERGSGYRSLITVLEERLNGPSGAVVGTLVLEREPALSAVTSLVRAICERPWEIRRPRDLAAVIPATIAGLKRALHPLGFRRVEHFITYVRFVALEQLVTQQHLPLLLARQLAGVADHSNLRRQFQRAQRGSAFSLTRLKRAALSLVVVTGVCFAAL